ncbi:MAG: ADP-dependent glucokinase/phosphofructokinase, partial [Candidatus Methanofastidiosia archaeon]
LFSLFSDFVVCYPFRLSRELAMLFRENVLFPRNSKLVWAMKAFKKTESERHFVFEFQEGFKAFDFEAPRENRFITSFVNPNLEFSKGFDEMLLSTKFEKAMISGFHLILEKYENGTYRDFLKKVKEHIKILKENETEIHLEFASINSERVKRAVISEILPLVSSLGLNEVELSSIMGFFKRDSSEDVISVLENLEFLKNRFELSRIHLHDFGYYLCLEERLNQNSLLYSSLAGASKAYFGEIRQREDLFRAFRVPISHLGLEKLRILGVYLESREFLDTGIFNMGDYFIDLVPTKIVSNPKSTVGLGDTISGIGFLGAE